MPTHISWLLSLTNFFGIDAVAADMRVGSEVASRATFLPQLKSYTDLHPLNISVDCRWLPKNCVNCCRTLSLTTLSKARSAAGPRVKIIRKALIYWYLCSADTRATTEKSLRRGNRRVLDLRNGDEMTFVRLCWRGVVDGVCGRLSVSLNVTLILPKHSSQT